MKKCFTAALEGVGFVLGFVSLVTAIIVGPFGVLIIIVMGLWAKFIMVPLIIYIEKL